ncbi:uncharacterized protein LOC143028154 [Oratosquilla oratoria]|uniref:uncharacterized protein LOC143028154 n=1 Tax=Oratosquilla oratoria TaxID=337810 RepID=UPI003F76ED20
MVTSCAGCSYNYWKFIKEFYLDDNAAIQFLRNHGVLPSQVQCPYCEVPCTYREDRHSWYCGRWSKIAKTKRRKQCNFTTTDYKGTFLEGTHLKPSEIVCFVNHWLQKTWNHDTVVKCLKWAPSTSINWRSFCSEVTDWWFDNQDSVGGEGVKVEIDKLKSVKQKQWAKRPGFRRKFFKQYFAHYMFLHTFGKEQVIHHFFIEAARLYHPQSNRQRPSGLPVIPQLKEEDSDSESDNDTTVVPPSQPSTSGS